MTRKKKRGMLKPFIIGAAIFLALTVLVPYLFGEADAVSKKDLSSLSENINELELTNTNLELEIEETRLLVISLEKQRRNMISDIRDTRILAANDWIHAPELDRQIKVLDEFNPIVVGNQTKLLQLRLQYQENLVTHDKLITKFQQDQIIYNNANQPDLSGLERLIGIRLSDSCIVMIQNNMSTPCPSYKDLLQLDSSLSEVSGYFTTDDNGYFHRGTPAYQNNCRLYDNDNELRIIVDPSEHCQTRIKVIEIRPNFHTYLLPDSLTQGEQFEYIDIEVNGTITKETRAIQVKNQTQEFGRIIYHDRFIDSCRLGYINADKWQLLLADTIHHIRSKCTAESTSYDTKEIIFTDKKEIDITQNQDYKHKQWLDYVKEFCIFKYKGCTG